MRTQPLGPSAELNMGPRNVKGCAEMGVEPHANAATGAFCGAPCGATKCVRGVPKWLTCGGQKAKPGGGERGPLTEAGRSPSLYPAGLASPSPPPLWCWVPGRRDLWLAWSGRRGRWREGTRLTHAPPGAPPRGPSAEIGSVRCLWACVSGSGRIYFQSYFFDWGRECTTHLVQQPIRGGWVSGPFPCGWTGR